MYFHRATPMAAMPIAPLEDVSRCSIASPFLQDSPWVSATKLLAQVRDQQPEGLEDERVLALRIVANGLLQDLVSSLVAIVCALRLYRVRDAVGHAVSSSHDGRLEAQDRLSRQTRCKVEEEKA